MTEDKLHHIVIVGGGAGGLVLATRLGHRLGRKRRARITLVDQSMTHVWKPLLHEVAAGTLETHTDDVIHLGHAKTHGYRFQPGRLTGIDRANRTITLAAVLDEEGHEALPERTVSYDTLVLAVGGVSNDFGTEGAREHCAFLDSVPQAERVQQRWLRACLAAQSLGGAADGALHMAIVGAGATGVELAAEMCKASRRLVSYNLDRIDLDRDVRITLIEGAPRVLPALPPRLAEITERELRHLGVEVLTNRRVAKITGDAIELADGERIVAHHKIWAAGVKGPYFLKDFGGLETTRSDQLVVDRTLRATRDEHVFALGDCAACPRPDSDRPVPPRAQAAYQQALLLARSLERRLDGKPLLEFTYRDYGSLVSISGSGIGNLMGNLLGDVMLEGTLARLAYLSLYKKHQQALHGWWWVALSSLIGLLRRHTEPRLKLH
jgi:NADH:ubiquinone reductase (H+-translocating)